MKKHIFRICLLLIFLFFAFYCIGCRQRTDEDLILEILDKIGSRVENKDIDGILIYLAEDYNDFRGRNKSNTRKMLESYFNQFRGIVVHMLGRRIEEMKPTEAVIQVEIAVSSGGSRVLRRLIRISTDNYRLNLKFVKRNDRWFIRHAEWKYISLDELFPESLSILKKILGKK